MSIDVFQVVELKLKPDTLFFTFGKIRGEFVHFFEQFLQALFIAFIFLFLNMNFNLFVNIAGMHRRRILSIDRR